MCSEKEQLIFSEGRVIPETPSLKAEAVCRPRDPSGTGTSKEVRTTRPRKTNQLGRFGVHANVNQRHPLSGPNPNRHSLTPSVTLKQRARSLSSVRTIYFP